MQDLQSSSRVLEGSFPGVLLVQGERQTARSNTQTDGLRAFSPRSLDGEFLAARHPRVERWSCGQRREWPCTQPATKEQGNKKEEKERAGETWE